jgi:putative acetyltransferase
MSTCRHFPYLIRPIQSQDNEALKQALFISLAEYEDAKEYIAETPQFSYMAEYYAKPGSRYWVVEHIETGEILGGGGYERYARRMPEGYPVSHITEFQKFYFHPKLRGQGLGKLLLQLALDTAAHDGYDTVYLETIPKMQAAISLYKRYGFVEIPEPWGKRKDETVCSVYMMLSLKATSLENSRFSFSGNVKSPV